MRIDGLSSPTIPQPDESKADPRTMLQVMLLKKTLEMQQEQVVSAMNQQEGKGLNIDIRA